MNVINKTFSEQENKQLFRKRIHSAILDVENYFANNTLGKPRLQMASEFSCVKSPESDMYLYIDLSGYGSLKKRWKTLLIGSGIVEGIVQGLVVGSATHNPWLGIGVGAEEITSEYLTWNGVDWILGDSFAPVTLEGELRYQDRIIWEDSFFVTDNDDALSKKDKKDKSKQLKASLHKAESELVVSLNNYLQAEVLTKPSQ